MSRRWIAALLAALTVLGLCGCGAKEKTDTRKATVPMADLRTGMLDAATSLPDMKSVSDESTDAEELFAYFSDLDYGKVEHFFLTYSAAGLADEIAVIAVKDAADAAQAKASLESHLKSRLQMYTQYNPDQVPRVENAEIFVKDRYVVLIVCDEADAVKAAFNRLISEN